MDNKTLLDKYRTQFAFALAVTIAISSAIEIAAYIIFVIIGVCELSLGDAYLRNKVITPIVINCINYLILTVINKSGKFSQDFKNEAIVHGASATAFVISVIHRKFIVTAAAFMFPMILSAMFNDKKLITKTFLISLTSLTTTFVLLWFDNAVDLTNFINIIVMYGFLSVSYLAGFISIKYSQRNFQLIESQALTNNKLQNIVLRDQMTGLYNHRTFYSELDSAIENFGDGKCRFCLAMIDIDNFKCINDKYGHDCGDTVIINLAKIIEQYCDTDDKACRYGGEEFAIIFSNKTSNQAEQIMKNILEKFAKTKYEFTKESITFSCGIADFNKNLTREEIFNIADKRMYSAKKNGKNQIEIR